MKDRACRQSMGVVAALVLVLSGCGESTDNGAAPSASPPALAVMSFNVLCSFCDLRNFDPWSERLVDFGDIVARHDPDLIGLQELSPPPINNGMEVEQILAHAPGRTAISFTSAPGAYPDATILYRTTRFNVLDHGSYWLSPTPDVPMSIGFAKTQLPRLVVWARLADNAAGGRELYFATTHFDNNSPSQEKSAPLLQERTAPFAANQPVIVVGDFNSRPDSTAYRILTTDASRGFVFQNAFDLTPLRVVTNQTPPPAYDVNDRIDHIFLAGSGITWSVRDWVVDLTVYGAKQRYPSDHFPVVAEVNF
jgi:endonuclease/exonuclease/phosphatase family metal-dependent hydrolase